MLELLGFFLIFVIIVLLVVIYNKKSSQGAINLEKVYELSQKEKEVPRIETNVKKDKIIECLPSEELPPPVETTEEEKPFIENTIEIPEEHVIRCKVVKVKIKKKR